MKTQKTQKTRKPKHCRGYVVIEPRGVIHLQTVSCYVAESWSRAERWFEMSRDTMKAHGYRCVRVEVREIVK